MATGIRVSEGSVFRTTRRREGNACDELEGLRKRWLGTGFARLGNGRGAREPVQKGRRMGRMAGVLIPVCLYCIYIHHV